MTARERAEEIVKAWAANGHLVVQIETALLAEREACASKFLDQAAYEGIPDEKADRVAAAIRSRGEGE